MMPTTPWAPECERLDQLELEPEQASSIAAIDADERFIEVVLAVL
jgi:hypothetical protein